MKAGIFKKKIMIPLRLSIKKKKIKKYIYKNIANF